MVDEFQKAPILLDAIKAELNQDLRPGRFVLTGSTRYSALPAVAQSLTGRVHVATLWPLTQGELAGERETFVEQLLTEPSAMVTHGRSDTTREEYTRRVLTGGLPLAVARPNAESRSRWFGNYLRLVLERDAVEVRRMRQQALLPQLTRLLAAQTAQVLNMARIADELGMDQTATRDYVSVLEAIFIFHRLSGWGRTLGARVGVKAKIHVVDSGLAGFLLGLTEERLRRRDPAALAQFGHLLETFAVGEIMRQVEWQASPIHLGHYRSQSQTEVDLVLERFDNRIAGVEIKAASSVSKKDIRGLVDLRDKLGESFVGGVVLYTGDWPARLDDRIIALPLDTLWKEGSGVGDV